MLTQKQSQAWQAWVERARAGSKVETAPKPPAPRRTADALMYLEDFKVGDEFTSPGITLTEAQIIDFALKFDPQPFHVDVTAAAAEPFGGLIASGFHTAALSFRLFWQTGVLGDASLGLAGLRRAALAQAGASRRHAARRGEGPGGEAFDARSPTAAPSRWRTRR